MLGQRQVHQFLGGVFGSLLTASAAGCQHGQDSESAQRAAWLDVCPDLVRRWLPTFTLFELLGRGGYLVVFSIYSLIPCRVCSRHPQSRSEKKKTMPWWPWRARERFRQRGEWKVAAFHLVGLDRTEHSTVHTHTANEAHPPRTVP